MPLKLINVVFVLALTCLSCATTEDPEFTHAIQKSSLPPAIQPEVQTGDWWMPRHEEKLARIQQGNVDLVMIGDSITHGWETGGKAVWERYYGQRNAVNLGFSGDRTEHVIWRLQHGEVDGISPKLCVVMIGTNNTGHRQDPPEDTALGIEYIVDELRKRLPDSNILLLAIFPRGATRDDDLRRLNDQINRRIAKLADGEHVYFLDISSVFLDDDGTLPRSIMPDLLHPNGEGYKLWAGAMERMVAKLMSDEST